MAKKTNFLQKKMAFSGLQVTIFTIVFAFFGLCFVLQSFAAPGGKGGNSSYTGTISLKLPPESDLNGNGLPNHGDVVRFNVSTTIPEPYVHLRCYQNNVLVAEGFETYFERGLSDGNFGLYSGQWNSSASADCTANLRYHTTKGKNNVVETSISTSFQVNP
jgi:hypothetical protein